MTIAPATDGARIGHQIAAGRLRFGQFELDERTLELARDGTPVPLQPQPARMLACLAARAGELVRREELRDLIWGELHVNAEQGLHNAVHQIRAALGDDADHPRFLETLPRAGYRFVAPVERLPAAARPPTLRTPAGWQAGQRRGSGRGRLWLAGGVALAAVAALALVLVGGSSNRERSAVRPPAGALRLAVLPFEILGDAPLEPLRSVLAEELITTLAAVAPDRLAVIARGSIRGYEETPPTLDRVARELRADLAVEGSLRAEGQRTVIASRLVRVADGATVWSGRAELEAGDPAAGADWLSHQVRDALVTRVVSFELPAPPPRPRPATAGAWEDFLEGRYLLARRNAGELDRARAAFGRSIAEDPEFAPARLGLAEALWRDAEDDAARRGAALAAVDEALARAPEDPMAHLLRGEIAFYHEWQAELAAQHYERALALGAGLSEVHAVHAFFLALRGEAAAALDEADLARELDPISAVTLSDVGVIYAYAGRPDLAVRECERALELAPGAHYAVACLIDSHVELGELGAAAALAGAWRAASEAGELLRFPPTASGDPAALAEFFAWRLERLSDPAQSVPPAWIGLAAARAGAVDRAVEALAAARRLRAPAFLLVSPSPAMRAVRRDSRFAGLVAGTPVARLAAGS